ncbi:MAG: PIN/TRAM domain-containing protein [Planctomycetota bacterium]
MSDSDQNQGPANGPAAAGATGSSGSGVGVPNPVEAAARQRELLLRIVRMAFLVLMLTVTLLFVIEVGDAVETTGLPFELASRWWLPVGACVVLAGLFLAADLITPNKKIQTIAGVIFGLVAGLIATLAMGFVIDLIAESWEIADQRIVDAAKVLLGISLVYLGITTVLQTQDDFRLVIPYVEFAKQIRGPRPLLLDSSALIDARIAELVETGLMQAPILVPHFVLSELQLLADSGDKLKRAKGRRGLDVVARLQRSAKADVSIDETVVPGASVDQMLIELGTQLPGMIVTGDVALSRMAGFQNVAVLNLNDVAHALKPSFVPGETLEVELVKPGEQEGQAVGYLEDGTMVVAEDGAGNIGQSVVMTVRSSLQTSAGRMIFARIGERAAGEGGVESPPEPEPETPRSDSKPEPRQAAKKTGPFPPRKPNPAGRPRSPRR